MSVAEIINFEPRLFGRQRERNRFVPISIPIALDDLGLSPAAFRVFCALSRRARLMGDGNWCVVEGLGEIGRICFAGALPTAKAPRLRIMASDAIRELEFFGLVVVDRVGRGRENRYQIMPQNAWKQPRVAWKKAKVRRPKSSASIIADAVVEAEIAGEVASSIDDQSAQVEPDIVCEVEITDEDGQPFEEIDPPDVPLSSFDHKTYIWEEFTIGCPQVPQRFWSYTLKLMEGVKRQREQTGHPNPIGEVEVFAQGVLRKQGQERYQYWINLSKPISETVANRALHWSETVPAIDPESARAIVHSYWRDLGLGWGDERLMAWMAQAERFFDGFKYSAAINFYNLPEPILAKLCGDLEATVRRLFPGAQS
jgi:hypothetical protein